MAENAKRRNPLEEKGDLPDSPSPEVRYGGAKRRTFGNAESAREAIGKGLQDSDAGRVVPVDEVRALFGLPARWKEADMHRVIEAIYEDGVLKPLENPGLPEHERVTLEIRYPEPPDPMSEEELDAWFREIDELATKIPQEDFERVDAALEEADKQAKEHVRRRMGLD